MYGPKFLHEVRSPPREVLHDALIFNTISTWKNG